MRTTFADGPAWGPMKDKVNQLFKLARKNKLTARQDFEDCQSCAGAALPESVDYTFYHHQDLESWMANGKLYLAFGSTKKTATENDELRVGQKVAELAKEVGLEVEWTGSVAQRIAVTNIWEPPPKKFRTVRYCRVKVFKVFESAGNMGWHIADCQTQEAAEEVANTFMKHNFRVYDLDWRWNHETGEKEIRRRESRAAIKEEIEGAPSDISREDLEKYGWTVVDEISYEVEDR